MEFMSEEEISFINCFSNSNICTNQFFKEKKLPKNNKFFNDDIGSKYIGNMIRSIDIRLYVAFFEMLKNGKISFSHAYDVKESVCEARIEFGITKNVVVKVPHIKNGMDLLATSHELGHALKLYTKIDNERRAYADTLFSETISILFGHICLNRYINDFGYDKYARGFEVLNINNALRCLLDSRIKISEYIEVYKKIETVSTLSEEERNNVYQNKSTLDKLRGELYTLISYPIGIALANVYDNFDEVTKRKYLELISKYLLNTKDINFEMILEYFDIPFDTKFYVDNFNEYINKFIDKESTFSVSEDLEVNETKEKGDNNGRSRRKKRDRNRANYR